MHDLGLVPAEDLGQRDPRLEGVEQPAVGQVEVDPRRDPQDLGGPLRLGQPDVRPGRVRRRLAVGQVDDPDSVPFPGQPGQRAAAGDLHVVGMRTTAIRSSSGSCDSAMRLFTSRAGGCDPPSIQSSPIQRLARPTSTIGLRSARSLNHRTGSRLVTARRNVGAIASNRSRSICSIPRAIETFQTLTEPASALRVW